MITIRCICTDKAQMRILRFSYLYYRRNPVASGEWFDSIPHFFVQKMHKLLSSLKYQGKVLQEEFGKLLGGKRTSKATAHLEALEELLTEKIIFYILHKSLRQLENV